MTENNNNDKFRDQIKAVVDSICDLALTLALGPKKQKNDNKKTDKTDTQESEDK